jgi:hypothetical protein
MIIWGSGSGGADLGQVELRQCPTCDKERPFKLFLQYSYNHVYYLRWVKERKYHLACDICRRGWELDPKETEAKLEKNPIPFMTRFGWTFLVGIISILLIAGSLTKH